jgi:monovalent cation/proton antiporter MnhG/PhaG subunit
VIGPLVGLAGGLALLLGLALASIGLYGMFRRPPIFEQLHAAGLVTGPGVILVLLASLASGSAEIATSGVLVVVFVLVTSSLSTHAIALAAWRLRTSTTPGSGAAGAELTERSGLAMRVLLAHDGSPGADVATSLVASLPWAEGSTIRLITVIEGDLHPLATQPSEPSDDPALSGLPALLDAAVDRLRRPGLTVDQVTRPGDAAAAIAAEADVLAADVLVLGSRGLGPLRALVLGSVAEAVVDVAPCPVLVARTPDIRSVLLGVDASGTSDRATDAVARWPIFEGVPIRVLSVATDVPRYGDRATGGSMREARERAQQQRVADLVAIRLRDAGRVALPAVRTGDATARILGVAQSERPDLIVLGSRGHTGVRRAVLGSVARGVLTAAETSVLIVKAPPG